MKKASEINCQSSYPYPRVEKKDNKTKQELKRREQARNTAREANEFANLVMSFVRGSNTFE
ncbi:hypothetical protein V039C_0026 [Vibrio phage V039C]|nr:hypothetical protein V039C_0026 [Vibrio phage V039C]